MTLWSTRKERQKIHANKQAEKKKPINAKKKARRRNHQKQRQKINKTKI